MIAKILEQDNKGNIKLNITVLTIPELKILVEKEDNYMDYFTHLFHLFDPESAYSEVDEIERPLRISNDFPVDETNPRFIIAKEKLESLYEDPIKRAFDAFRKQFENTNRYFNSTDSYSHGKDGNFSEIQRAMEKMPEMMDKYEQVEIRFKKKLSAMRGNKEEEMDKDIDYSEGEIDKIFN
jgi:hypothetical protein